jgi:hypothetical protein
MRSGRFACICASMFVAFVLAEAPSPAQTRFQVLAQETNSDVVGLRFVILRDSQLAACYTLFIMESAPAERASEAVAPAPAEDSAQQSIQRLRAAAAKRDREIAALKAEYDAKFGTAREVAPGQSARNPAPAAFIDYEWKRLKIEAEYADVLRTEIPGRDLWAVAAPGMRSGGWEDGAEALRRALINPDPGTLRSPDDPTGINSRLESWFQRVIETPRLAASGPVPCPAGDAKGRASR